MLGGVWTARSNLGWPDKQDAARLRSSHGCAMPMTTAAGGSRLISHASRLSVRGRGGLIGDTYVGASCLLSPDAYHLGWML
jgi:hypothetical protein